MTTSEIPKSAKTRKREIANKIEKDIEFLLENPLKLRKFQGLLKNIRQKQKRERKSKHSQDFINKNILLDHKPRCQTRYCLLIPYSCDQRIKNVKNRRYIITTLEREKKIVSNNRWELFRQHIQKQKHTHHLMKVANSRTKYFITLLLTRDIFRRLRNEVNLKREEMVLNNLKVFASCRIIKNYKRKMKSFGEWLMERDCNRVRQSLSFLSNIQYEIGFQKGSNIIRSLLGIIFWSRFRWAGFEKGNQRKVYQFYDQAQNDTGVL